MADCICDFQSTCRGTGMLHCSGCGGDLCVCAACFGHGETECDGCDECPRDDDTDDFADEARHG
jgi:hypothetical protein